MYTLKGKRKIVFQQIVTLLSCQVQSKGVYAKFKSRDDIESGHGLNRWPRGSHDKGYEWSIMGHLCEANNLKGFKRTQ